MPTPFYRCPYCEAVSYHPKDIEQSYCGRCHRFSGAFRPSVARPLKQPFTNNLIDAVLQNMSDAELEAISKRYSIMDVPREP